MLTEMATDCQFDHLRGMRDMGYTVATLFLFQLFFATILNAGHLPNLCKLNKLGLKQKVLAK